MAKRAIVSTVWVAEDGVALPKIARDFALDWWADRTDQRHGSQTPDGECLIEIECADAVFTSVLADLDTKLFYELGDELEAIPDLDDVLDYFEGRGIDRASMDTATASSTTNQDMYTALFPFIKNRNGAVGALTLISGLTAGDSVTDTVAEGNYATLKSFVAANDGGRLPFGQDYRVLPPSSGDNGIVLDKDFTFDMNSSTIFLSPNDWNDIAFDYSLFDIQQGYNITLKNGTVTGPDDIKKNPSRAPGPDDYYFTNFVICTGGIQTDPVSNIFVDNITANGKLWEVWTATGGGSHNITVQNCDWTAANAIFLQWTGSVLWAVQTVNIYDSYFHDTDNDNADVAGTSGFYGSRNTNFYAEGCTFENIKDNPLKLMSGGDAEVDATSQRIFNCTFRDTGNGYMVLSDVIGVDCEQVTFERVNIPIRPYRGGTIKDCTFKDCGILVGAPEVRSVIAPGEVVIFDNANIQFDTRGTLVGKLSEEDSNCTIRFQDSPDIIFKTNARGYVNDGWKSNAIFTNSGTGDQQIFELLRTDIKVYVVLHYSSTDGSYVLGSTGQNLMTDGTDIYDMDTHAVYVGPLFDENQVALSDTAQTVINFSRDRGTLRAVNLTSSSVLFEEVNLDGPGARSQNNGVCLLNYTSSTPELTIRDSVWNIYTDDFLHETGGTGGYTNDNSTINVL